MSSLGHSHGSEALGSWTRLCSNTHPLRTSSVLHILDLSMCSAINFQVLVQFPIMLNFIYRRFFPTFNPPRPLGSCQHNYHPIIHFRPFHCQTLSLKKKGELSKYQRSKHQKWGVAILMEGTKKSCLLVLCGLSSHHLFAILLPLSNAVTRHRLEVLWMQPLGLELPAALAFCSLTPAALLKTPSLWVLSRVQKSLVSQSLLPLCQRLLSLSLSSGPRHMFTRGLSLEHPNTKGFYTSLVK